MGAASQRPGTEATGRHVGGAAGHAMVALLFTDLVDSTASLGRLGDEAGQAVRRAHFELLRNAVARWHGAEVKNLGDGLMVAFPSAIDALGCAAEIQRAVSRDPHLKAHPVRIGIHAGEPVREDDDYFGMTVVIAKRLCDSAAGGQVLVSELMRGLAGSRTPHELVSVGRLGVKGVSERLPAYELAWASDRPSVTGRAPATRLTGQPGVLRSRLLPPRPPPDALVRPELLSRLRRGLAGRLVSVVAGAGYGKSTLLAQGVADIGTPWVWLSCDGRMTAAEPLLAHLVEGLQERFPGVGVGLALEGHPAEQAAQFCNEIVETIAEDFVIVVDDVHALGGRAAQEALALLVRDLPPNVHLALASRNALPLPLSRLRAAGGLTELSEVDLSLSGEESAALVRSLRGDASGEAADLHRRTEGWMAGLILAARTASRGATLGAAEFDYLAEEVMADLPARLQQFLRDTAVLGRISPQIAAAVSGLPDAGKLLADLVRRHLFTTRLEAEGEWYRYHHLLTAHLRQDLEARDPARLRALHLRAAKAWRGLGQPLEAVRHHIAANDWSGAADALEPVADDLAAGPEAEILDAWLKEIPVDRQDERPGLILARATRLLARPDLETAFAAFEHEISVLVEHGDSERGALALSRLLAAMFAAGTRPGLRAEVGARWIGRLDPDAAALPAARVFQAIGCAYALRFDEAEAELDAAVRSVDADDVIVVYAAAVRAHFLGWARDGRPEALGALEASIAALDRDPGRDRLAFTPWLRMLRAYLLNDLGRFSEGLEESERATAAADRRGLSRAPGRGVAWLRAVALAGLERWDELAAELAPPERAPGMELAPSYGYRYHVSAAVLAAAHRDSAETCAHVRLAREGMRRFDSASDDAVFLCDLAVAAHQVGEADLAREIADEARAAARAVGAVWQRARAALVSAAVLDGDDADGLLAEALELSSDPLFETLWTGRERRLAAPLLARALASSVGPDGLAGRLLARCGGEVLSRCATELAVAPVAARIEFAQAAARSVSVDGDVIDSLLRDRDAAVRSAARQSWAVLRERPRASLGITTLGELRVWRDGAVVSNAAFGRQKARALLAFLLARGGPVHREELCEALWPELAHERASAALRTTLHDLRRALHPEIDSGSSVAAIAADGETVRVAIGERDTLDLSDLESAAADVRVPDRPRDIARLENVVAMYRGPFLAEWPYEDWAAARRDEVEEAFRLIVEELALALARAGRHRTAAEHWRRLVSLDPEREGWHRGLMRSYAAGDERALALRQFHACRAVLRRRQGIEPGAETRSLYAAILKEEPTNEEGAP